MKKKLISFICAASISYAGILSNVASSLENKAKSEISSNITNKIIDLTGAKKTLLNDILKGTNLKNIPGMLGLDSFINSISFGYVNLKCVKPKFQVPKFDICSMDFSDKFNIKVGPCQSKVQNPIKSIYDDLCSKNKKNTVTSNPSNVNFLDGAVSGLAKGMSLSDIYTPNGISYADIYGKDDGSKPSFYASLAKKNPSSPLVSNWVNNNKKILILEDKTIKEKGTTDLSQYTLPKTKGEWLKYVYNTSKSYADIIPDYLALLEEIDSKLMQKFPTITGDSLSAIRSQEYQYWYNLVKNSDIKNIYNVVSQAYDSYYANKLLLLNAKSKYYQYAPTQDRLQYIPISKRTDIKYKSLIYTAQVVDLMSKKEIAKKRAKENISLVLKAGYIESLDFREDIAQKQIQQLLNSVK